MLHPRVLVGPQAIPLVVPLVLSSLLGCSRGDDVVVRPVSVTSSGGAPLPACEGGPPTIPVVTNTSAPLSLCSAWVARRSFANALCSCDSLSVPNAFRTSSFDSGIDGEDPLEGGAAVGINGAYSGSDNVRVNGSFTIAGNEPFETGVLGLDINGDLRLAGQADALGPISVARDAWLLDTAYSTVSGYVARDLHLGPAGALNALLRVTVVGATLNEAFGISAPCPCAPGELLDVTGIVNDVMATNDNARVGLGLDALTNIQSPTTVALSCGRYALQAISGSAPLTLEVGGNVVLAVNGDVALPPGFTLKLDPGAELDWFISGNLELPNDATIGDEGRPAAVRLYIFGENQISFPGTPAVSMNLYAPRADVVVELLGDVYGSLFARSVAASAVLFINYDRAVLRADESCNSDPPQTCTSCGGCSAGSACVAGACSPCTTDADCCFPLVCESGACKALTRESSRN